MCEPHHPEAEPQVAMRPVDKIVSDAHGRHPRLTTWRDALDLSTTHAEGGRDGNIPEKAAEVVEGGGAA